MFKFINSEFIGGLKIDTYAKENIFIKISHMHGSRYYADSIHVCVIQPNIPHLQGETYHINNIDKIDTIGYHSITDTFGAVRINDSINIAVTDKFKSISMKKKELN